MNFNSSNTVEYVLVEILIVVQLAKKFPTFYGSRRFATKRPPLKPILCQLNAVQTLKNFSL
jgi:hypothetical protein